MTSMKTLKRVCTDLADALAPLFPRAEEVLYLSMAACAPLVALAIVVVAVTL